jgi:hypothetical protein
VSRRTAGGLRVWLDRPWWSSGEGELLGVVLTSDGGTPSDLEESFTTRWGRDPVWISRATDAAPALAAFGRAVVSQSGLSVANNATATVAVAGHVVEFDPDRGLWYCDLDVDAGDSYFPFVRLALARYQPDSLVDAHLSAVVTTDPIQLLPQRTTIAAFSPTNRRAVTVTVNGRSYVGADGSRAVVAVGVERRRPGVPGGDLGWTEVSTTGAIVSRVKDHNLVTWKAAITLPADRGTEPMRITVTETETFTSGGSRVSYVDALEI